MEKVGKLIFCYVSYFFFRKSISHTPDRLDKVSALPKFFSQPHDLNLLSRANTQALKQLKHSLRNCPQAQKLKNARPDLTFFQRLAQYSRSGCSAAACLVILLLVRFGVIDSLDNCHTEGQKVMKNYYTQHLGDDMADDLFQA